MTNQRIKILEYLRSVKCHPTADMVHHAVSKQLPAITLATVYRNLNLLAEQRKILRMDINNEYRYDATCKCHEHCICSSCGMITDICEGAISRYALSKVHVANFTPQSVCIFFYGTCKNCEVKRNG